MESKPLVAFNNAHGYTEDLFFYTPSPHADIILSKFLSTYYATFKTSIPNISYLGNLIFKSVVETILIKFLYRLLRV